MLKAPKPISQTRRARGVAGQTFVIVASKYNPRYVNSMLRGATATLKKAGVRDVRIHRVPGAFEIPVVAAAAASDPLSPVAAVLCLGVILRGATTHADHIGQGVTSALIQIQVQAQVPMIHEVLLLENHEQARERCLNPRNNRGVEAAQTALEMAALMRRLRR